MESRMNERIVVAEALAECKESLEYVEKRLSEVGSNDRAIRNNLKDRFTRVSTRIETIIDLAHALGVISEEESLMEPDALIELIEEQG